MTTALLDRCGAVAILTFHRPDARNAVNSSMALAIAEGLDEVAADAGVRAVVLTGAGDVAFCAGADLHEAAAGRSAHSSGQDDYGFAGIVRHPIHKPLIAAVNGYAIGGGMEIVLACDLAVASERATFGLPEVKLGIVAGAGGLVRLRDHVPVKVAMRWLLTGEPISAQEAERWGLVNAVVPHERVVEEAVALAAQIARNAPLAVGASKRAVLEVVDGARAGEALRWRLSDDALAFVRRSADAREGPRAFAEKREPRWQGA